MYHILKTHGIFLHILPNPNCEQLLRSLFGSFYSEEPSFDQDQIYPNQPNLVQDSFKLHSYLLYYTFLDVIHNKLFSGLWDGARLEEIDWCRSTLCMTNTISIQEIISYSLKLYCSLATHSVITEIQMFLLNSFEAQGLIASYILNYKINIFCISTVKKMFSF